jgi:hypothetical protein
VSDEVNRSWVQGFGLALSEAYANGASGDSIARASFCAGLYWHDYRAAGLERFDLERLRRAGVLTRKQADKAKAGAQVRLSRVARGARRGGSGDEGA